MAVPSANLGRGLAREPPLLPGAHSRWNTRPVPAGGGAFFPSNRTRLVAPALTFLPELIHFPRSIRFSGGACSTAYTDVS